MEEIIAEIDCAKLIELIYCEVNNSENFEVFHENVILACEPLENVDKEIKEYIKGLGCENKTLVITDPYLFKGNQETKKRVIKLLIASKAKKIISLIDIDNINMFDKKFYELVKEGLKCKGIKLECIKNNEFHDRFWFCLEEKKGFILGTSLNGVAKRISLLADLEQKDMDVVLEVYNEIIRKKYMKKSKTGIRI